MPIITILLVIIIAGFLVWAINRYIPMEPVIKNILNIVVVVLIIVWLLQIFEVWHLLTSVRI